MKRLILGLTVALALACALVSRPGGGLVLVAQSLPYTLTVTWDASPDTGVASYNCALDGVFKVSVTAPALTCSFPVTTLGAHTVSVTAVNPTAIPTESAAGPCAAPLPSTCAFTLRQPSPATGIKVR